MIVAAAAPPMSTRDAVRAAIVARYGARTHIYSILVKGPYALAQGTNLHDGLQQVDGRWQIVCRLPNGTAQVTALQSRCGFPQSTAAVLSVEEPINFASGQGNFAAAKAMEQRAYASATGPQREIDRARLQLLTQLELQMRLQQITRTQAMQQWNQLRYSWALPW
jgi:invasion protein IalB